MNITDKEELCRRAVLARQSAYAPYSEYMVGAAVLTSGGKIYTGANIENSSYPAGICAEISAAAAAVNAGDTVFEAIAVASENPGDEAAYPCGVCRQFLSEFIHSDIPVYLISGSTEPAEESFYSIFPNGFKLKGHNDNE